ncbi:MAG: amidohydrolase [Myxococcota bacterium]|nr:amidohydrolase [Myxococcota bacterium]
MRILAIALISLLLLGVVLFVNLTSGPGPAPARLFVGGPILTLDADDRVASALATEADRIVAVGSEAELREWAQSEGAEIVELAGRALVPGFIDAHGHFPGAGLGAVFVDLNSPPIGSVTDLESLVALLAREAEDTPEGEWIIGFGYDDTLLPERRHPTRRDLDQASTSHPIGVLHISGHLGVANSLGLDETGIGPDTPDPEGGVIRREADGRTPDGVLEETAMESLQRRLVPGARQGLEILRRAGELYLENGVTTAQSGYTEAGLMRLLDWASWLGMVPVRLVVWPDTAAAQAILDGELEVGGWDPLRYRVGAVKIVADGSIQGYTGYLSEPYHVPPGDDPTYRGYPRIPRDELIEEVGRFHRAGLQIAVHGNGDASIEDILDAVEQAQRETPRDDTRHVVIHAQMTRDDQLDRMAALGLVPSFFSLHTFYWGDRHRTIFMGPERAARMSPAEGAKQRGIRFTIHADAPVVPMEPLRLVWSAVNRETRSGFVVGPEQRIPVMDALRATTLDAARQHFEEADKGSLEPGKLADLVVLSRNPLDDPATIDEIEVEETWIGGHRVYAR